MTYEECEQRLKQELETIYDVGEAAFITDWIMEDFTDANRQYRRLNSSLEIASASLSKIEVVIQQLLLHKPLQYVLGYALFYGYKFQVNEAVLIPRPETEELVQWIIDDSKIIENPFTILDIGTGSGCIPIPLKKQLPLAEVSSIDISMEALETAKINAIENNTKVFFQQANFLDENEWIQLEKYNIIVSNPPYIPTQEKAIMHKNVAEWEPTLALFVPDEDPLIFYRKIALFGKKHLQKGGCIYVETHKDFAIDVQQLFDQQGYAAELKKDMHGNDRMIKAECNW